MSALGDVADSGRQGLDVEKRSWFSADTSGAALAGSGSPFGVDRFAGHQEKREAPIKLEALPDRAIDEKRSGPRRWRPDGG